MEYDTLVFIGRFEPFHNGHKAVIDKALTMADQVIVVVGSSFGARDIRNPFTFSERKDMIEETYRPAYAIETDRIHVTGIPDYPYDDNKWIGAVQHAVSLYLPEGKIGLIGHSKDHTSYYLNIFPNWGSVEVENVGGLNATDIRNDLLSNRFSEESFARVENFLPYGTMRTIRNLVRTGSDLDKMADEYAMISKYKESWKAAPFPPTFLTTDAVVVQSGHVLLVKRKASPGKGLWAIPGGFLEQNETLLDGTIRELKQETKIKVPVPVLKGSIKETKVFDAPNRSTRGRTVTQATFFDLGNGPLPKVTGADDAEKAKWAPFSEVRREDMFEDHFSILDYFLSLE